MVCDPINCPEVGGSWEQCSQFTGGCDSGGVAFHRAVALGWARSWSKGPEDQPPGTGLACLQVLQAAENGLVYLPGASWGSSWIPKSRCLRSRGQKGHTKHSCLPGVEKPTGSIGCVTEEAPGLPVCMHRNTSTTQFSV